MPADVSAAMLLQKLVEQHKQQLAQAVAAAQQQELAMHSQQVNAEVQARVTQIQVQHEAELQALRERHAQQQSAAQAVYAAQIAAVEAEAEQHRQRLEQVCNLYDVKKLSSKVILCIPKSPISIR